MFGLILEDRGTEFSDVAGIERGGRYSAYFTDSMCAGQKGACERGHVELRKIIPEGTPIDGLRLDPWLMAGICSHTDSNLRLLIGDESPAALAEACLPRDFARRAGRGPNRHRRRRDEAGAHGQAARRAQPHGGRVARRERDGKTAEEGGPALSLTRGGRGDPGVCPSDPLAGGKPALDPPKTACRRTGRGLFACADSDSCTYRAKVTLKLSINRTETYN